MLCARRRQSKIQCNNSATTDQVLRNKHCNNGKTTATTAEPLQQRNDHYNNGKATATTSLNNARPRAYVAVCVAVCVVVVCSSVWAGGTGGTHTETTTLQHLYCNNHTATCALQQLLPTCTLACLCCSKCFGNCACALTNTGGGGERGVHEDIHWNITHCNTLQRTEHCTTLHSLQHTKTH